MGRAREKIGVLSFVLEGVHPHDLATIADLEGVAIRAGHHCAQPVMDRLGIVATARASFAVYNTAADVENLHRAVLRASPPGCNTSPSAAEGPSGWRVDPKSNATSHPSWSVL